MGLFERVLFLFVIIATALALIVWFFLWLTSWMARLEKARLEKWHNDKEIETDEEIIKMYKDDPKYNKKAKK